MKNTKLYNGKQRYEIIASNGHVLDHGFTSQKKCKEQIKRFKENNPNEKFYMSGYDNGKYGLE